MKRKTYLLGRLCKICGCPVADADPSINNGDYHRRCLLPKVICDDFSFPPKKIVQGVDKREPVE